MSFEFATAGRITVGEGTLQQAGAHAAALGTRALVIGGASAARLAPLLAVLDDAGVSAVTVAVAGEPTVQTALDAVARARAAAADVVIGMGGGSVIDTAKAAAALLTNPGDPLDYLEVVGRGQPLRHAAAPVIAIPTTAGAGAEVTKNAVLAVPARRVKVSLRHNSMLPAVALVDPTLTHSLPPAVTAATGMDALTQCLEPFVSHLSTPLTDGFCREGMQRAARSLRRAVEEGHDAAARFDMALAALCGGLALANAKLGAVHGFAGPLGGMFDAPHGAVCARLLPLVMAANVDALRTREPDAPALIRYAEVARLLTGRADADVGEGVAWVAALCADLAIPGLRAYGMTQADIPVAVEKAKVAGSMKGNPIALTDTELSGILESAL